MVCLVVKGIKLEVQSNVRNVVERTLVKVEPDQLVSERIFISNSAAVGSRWNLSRENNV